MPLATGTRLGNYEIVGPLGKGGMGEVYRARDTKLDREVAVKVLPAGFADHPERLARFEREAKVLASLNHPNIATIYAVEESSEGKALVMELVPGETLKGPVPLETALKYAAQIARALDAAHEKGIIHRDLKPANIMLTPDGLIKVLDFGLAAVTLLSAENEAATLTMSPTKAGMILGTAAYMSPEQASGKIVDRRTDIWAFGVVLWELLTGKRLFTGDTTSHILASVLKDDPDLNVVPVRVQRLLQACLQKEAGQRLDSIRDWRFALDEQAAPQAKARATSKLSWIIAAALALGMIGLTFVHFWETPPVEQTLRYSIATPENGRIHSFALSPDGSTLVFAAQVDGKLQLWLRPMDALEAQPMPFTEDATYPFWSPDSRTIGFFTEDKLKKIAVAGGPAQSLCDARDARGGSWNGDTIVFSAFSLGSGPFAIQRVAAAGGVPADVASSKGDRRHPVFLPGGSHFLNLHRAGTPEQSGIYVNSLDGKEEHRILADVSGMLYAPAIRGGLAGHILFVRENTLMAAPFDATGARVSGDVFPVVDGVTLTTNNFYLPGAVSESGVLLYRAGASREHWYEWADRSGKPLELPGVPGRTLELKLSPDQKLAVFRRIAGSGADVWVRDLNRGTELRLTTDPSTNSSPFWSPKGDRIVFSSNRKGGIFGLYQKAADGSGRDELLLEDNARIFPTQWSQDGRFIVYIRMDPKSKADLWVLPADGAAGGRKPILFLQSEFNESYGQLSPDSHWMAFTSDRSGRPEVYVRPFPSAEGEQALSSAGGSQPLWRADGKELFFRGADGKMMSVAVNSAAGTKGSFVAGPPTALFGARVVSGTNGVQYGFDVSADGQRFLMNGAPASGASTPPAPPLTVVTNWQAWVRK